MPGYTIDWDTTDLDGATTITGAGDDVVVTVSTPAGGTGAGEEWTLTTGIGDADGELIANHVNDPTLTMITFDSEVSGIEFELYDIDSGSGWDDTVTVYAVDATGAYVPISFSDLGIYHTTGTSADGNGYTVDASGHNNSGVEGSGAADSVTVTIAGPITGIVIVYDNGESNNSSGVIGIGDITFDEYIPPCFVRGTMIETNRGDVAIEELLAGDMIRTADNGMQPIRWIGSKTVSAKGKMAPIRIQAGSMGNKRDLLLSPAHRVVLQGWQTELLFGNDQMLASAKSLVNDSTITAQKADTVEYFHILFDRHEIIFSEGLATESFHPAEENVGTMAAAAQAEIYDLFPQLQNNAASYGPAARETLMPHEVALMNA